MSNFLAIAAVTKTLAQVLNDAVGQDVTGATVTTVRPAASPGSGGAASVNLFLYQVTPNAAARNNDLPTRRQDGTTVQRPRAALDLHYLVSFGGNEKDLEPQRLLGSVCRTLHAHPVLQRDKIKQIITATSYLNNSDLVNEVDLIRFTPLSISLEELSKLWSIFFQVPYLLSVAYVASVVFVEGSETPQSALPVSVRNVYAVPFTHPKIDRIVADENEAMPITSTNTLRIEGADLRGDITNVLIDDLSFSPTKVSDSKILLKIDPAVRAGIKRVEIVHQLSISTPPQDRSIIESNVFPFVFAPTITNTGNPTSSSVTLQVKPNIGGSQKATLLLNESQPPQSRRARSFSFDAVNVQDNSNTVSFAISGVPAGVYLVRIRIDGAESPLDIITDKTNPLYGQYSGTPKVTIP